MFTNEQLRIVEFCAQECKRQGSGEESVSDMVNAWNFAVEYNDLILRDNTIDIDFIERLGMRVEPAKNVGGFRKVPIGVGNKFEWHEKAFWERIPELLERLITSYYEGNLDPKAVLSSMVYYNKTRKLIKKAKTAEDVFYFHYEDIHPFVDGNGRTGKILYNYLRGTLNDPQMPPNFWNISNP